MFVYKRLLFASIMKQKQTRSVVLSTRSKPATARTLRRIARRAGYRTLSSWLGDVLEKMAVERRAA